MKLWNWPRGVVRHMDGWLLTALLTGCVVVGLLLSVLPEMLSFGPEWAHLSKTVLPLYLLNTAVMVLGVVVLGCCMAIPAAWLVSFYEFKARRIFEWVLIAPLAIPTYVAAFTYYEALGVFTPLLLWIRSNWSVEAYRVAETLLRYGTLMLLMAAVLYPYLYLAARAAFEQGQRTFIEAARMMGKGPLVVLCTVVLPLSRPALMAGLSLIVMEVLNDYGAVHFFGVPTLTEGIFRTWFALGDHASGIRLAGLVGLGVFVAGVLEFKLRGRARYAEEFSQGGNRRVRLKKFHGALAFGVCCVPLALGFLFPLGQLLYWAYLDFEWSFSLAFFAEVGRSLWLSILTAALLGGLALVLAYSWQLHNSRALRLWIRASTSAYALPGVVVAIAVMVSFGRIDGWLDEHGKGPWLSGSILAVGLAYMVRFLAVAFGPMHAGMTRVGGNLQEASRSLGCGKLKTFMRIYLPLLKGTWIVVVMLVFVEIIKELPLTLVLRPAGFETLSITAFGLAKEGRLYESALPSLTIVGLSCLGLLVLNAWMRKKDEYAQ